MPDPVGMTLPVKPKPLPRKALWWAALFVLAMVAGIAWGYRRMQEQNQVGAVQMEQNAVEAQGERVTSFTEELGGKNSHAPLNTPTTTATAAIPPNTPDFSTPPLPSSFPKQTPGTVPGTVSTDPATYPASLNSQGGTLSPEESLRAASWQQEQHAMQTAPVDVVATQNPAPNLSPGYQPPSNPAPMVNAPASNNDPSHAAKAEPLMKRLPPEGDYIIPVGTWIPAQLDQKVVSDVSGDLEATMTENLSIVKNGQKVVLIPQKSRLIGSYGSRMSYGQNRVVQIWSKIVLPDHSYILLADLNGTDADGSSGVTGRTNNHIGRLLRDAAITTAFAVGIAFTQQRNASLLTAPTFGDSASAAVGQQLAQLGSMQFGMNFNRQPTTTLEPGKEFHAFVNRTIILDGPYTPMTSLFGGTQ